MEASNWTYARPPESTYVPPEYGSGTSKRSMESIFISNISFCGGLDGARRNNNEFAGVGFSHEVLLRPADRGQGIGLGDEWRDFIAFDVADEISEDVVLLECAAQEAEVAQIDGAQVHLRDGAADRSGQGVLSAEAKQLEVGRHRCPADDIDDDVDGLGADFCGQVGSAFDDLVGSVLANLCGLRCRAHGEDRGATAFGKLYCRHADSA